MIKLYFPSAMTTKIKYLPLSGIFILVHVLSYALMAQEDVTSSDQETVLVDYSPLPCMVSEEEKVCADDIVSVATATDATEERKQEISSVKLYTPINSTAISLDTLRSTSDPATFKEAIQSSSADIFGSQEHPVAARTEHSINENDEALKIASLAFSLAAHLASLQTVVSSDRLLDYARSYIKKYTSCMQKNSRESMPSNAVADLQKPVGAASKHSIGMSGKVASASTRSGFVALSSTDSFEEVLPSHDSTLLTNLSAAIENASESSTEDTFYHNSLSASMRAIHAMAWYPMSINEHAAEYAYNYALGFFQKGDMLKESSNLKSRVDTPRPVLVLPQSSRLFNCFSRFKCQRRQRLTNEVLNEPSHKPVSSSSSSSPQNKLDKEWHRSWILASSWVLAQEWDYALMQNKLQSQDLWCSLNTVDTGKAYRAIDAWSKVIQIFGTDSNSLTAVERATCLQIANERKDFWSVRIEKRIINSQNKSPAVEELHQRNLRALIDYLDVSFRKKSEDQRNLGESKNNDDNSVEEAKDNADDSVEESKNSDQEVPILLEKIGHEKKVQEDHRNKAASIQAPPYFKEQKLAIDEVARQAEAAFTASEASSHWEDAINKAKEVELLCTESMEKLRVLSDQITGPLTEQFAQVANQKIFWQQKREEASLVENIKKQSRIAEALLQEAQKANLSVKWEGALDSAIQVASDYQKLIDFIEQAKSEEETPDRAEAWNNKLVKAQQEHALWKQKQLEATKMIAEISSSSNDKHALVGPFYPILMEERVQQATKQVGIAVVNAVKDAKCALEELSSEAQIAHSASENTVAARRRSDISHPFGTITFLLEDVRVTNSTHQRSASDPLKLVAEHKELNASNSGSTDKVKSPEVPHLHDWPQVPTNQLSNSGESQGVVPRRSQSDPSLKSRLIECL